MSCPVYSQQAEAFADQYERLSAEIIHADWIPYLPKAGMALDIGAGTGRDAAWLVTLGFEVYAVEPAAETQQQVYVELLPGCCYYESIKHPNFKFDKANVYFIGVPRLYKAESKINDSTNKRCFQNIQARGNMITRSLLKEEINKVREEHLAALYNIIKIFELPVGTVVFDADNPHRIPAAIRDSGWSNFIKDTYGCLKDDPIERGFQGDYEGREVLE